MKKINLKFKKMYSSRSKMLGLVSAIVVLIILEVSLSSFLSVNTRIASHLHTVFKDKKLNISRKPSKSDNITTILKTRTKSKSSKVANMQNLTVLVRVFRESNTIPVISKQYDRDTPSTEFNALDIFEGDSVVFSTGFKFWMKGLNEISVMRFAGDVIFMNCLIQSDDHGERKPFLHYDNIVHGVKMRPYPRDWNRNDPHVGRGQYSYNKVAENQGRENRSTYYFIAQGRRDGYYKYSSPKPAKIFSPYKTKSSGTFPNKNAFVRVPDSPILKQRNNQKEGLNVEILNALLLKKQFVAGLDPDELIYFDYDKSEIGGSINNGNLKAAFRYITKDKWKEYNFADGDNSFEQLNSTMLTILTMHKILTNPNPRNAVKAYEILDDRLYIYKDNIETIDGKDFDNKKPQPMFNNKRPVYYSPSLQNKPLYQQEPTVFVMPGFPNATVDEHIIDLDMNVLSPLEGVRKNVAYNQLTPLHRSSPEVNFYGIIDGPIHVSRNQQNVTYTVQSLPEYNAVPGKFQLVYTYEDNYGIIKQQKSGFLHKNSNKFSIDFEGGGYHDLTLRYFRNKQTKTSVIIAGCELIDIDVRFISAPNEVQGSDFSNNATVTFGNQSSDDLTKYAKLNEAKGNGKNWFIEDKIDTYNINNYGQKHGYDDPRVMKTYVLGDKQSIALTVNDGDPHAFVHYNTDYYLSERKLSKRLQTNMMNNKSGNTVLKWEYDDNIDFKNAKLLNYGRHCNITPNNMKNVSNNSSNATFYVRAIYNNASNAVVKIRRKFTPNTLTALTNNSSVNDIGQVQAYKLSDAQFDVVKSLCYNNSLPASQTKEDFMILKVENVLSNFTYVTGDRAKSFYGSNAQSLDYREVGEHKRFSPENNYNADYSWTFMGGVTGLSLLGNNDERYAKLPNRSWVRHLDGLPASPELPSGFIHNRFAPFDGTEEFSFATHDNNNTAGSSTFEQFEKWQLRMPWISQTGTHGYKTRWNIKCLYDVNKIFDEYLIGRQIAYNFNDADAYREKVEGINGLKIHPGLTDRKREELQFFYNLKHRRMVVVTKSNYNKLLNNGIQIQVFQKTGVSTQIGRRVFNGLLPNSIDEQERRSSSDTEDLTENVVQLAVYPNPSINGIFNVNILSNESTLEAMTLYNIVGKEIYSYPLQKINGQLEIKVGENLSLVSGVYLLKITIDGTTRTEKLIVN